MDDRGPATTCGEDDHIGCLFVPPCPEHAQRSWVANRMVRELHHAVHGDTWARPESPAAVWDQLLDSIAERGF